MNKRLEKGLPRTLGLKKKKEIVRLKVHLQLRTEQKQTERENK
jgi:hypothetical protein